jgi:hypothetical protein
MHNRKKEKSFMGHDGLSQLRKAARSRARAGRWSQRAIAQHLGRDQAHINQVLTGKRTSRSLLEKIILLPPRQDIPRNSKYRKAS